MLNIRLTQPLLVGDKHCEAGDVVAVTNVRADELIRQGYAERVDGAVEVKNPDHNPLADAISPQPPDGVNVSPLDALLPKVEDNPGLLALETAATNGGPRRAAKLVGKTAPAERAADEDKTPFHGKAD